jgi:hypothetical protein
VQIEILLQHQEQFRMMHFLGEENNQVINTGVAPASCPDSFPDLMTKDQLTQYLQIPSISNAKNYSNVIDNLIRMRDLPRIKICNTLLFPKKAILQWIDKQTIPE